MPFNEKTKGLKEGVAQLFWGHFWGHRVVFFHSVLRSFNGLLMLFG
jgi:hypothetical protein